MTPPPPVHESWFAPHRPSAVTDPGWEGAGSDTRFASCGRTRPGPPGPDNVGCHWRVSLGEDKMRDRFPHPLPLLSPIHESLSLAPFELGSALSQLQRLGGEALLTHLSRFSSIIVRRDRSVSAPLGHTLSPASQQSLRNSITPCGGETTAAAESGRTSRLIPDGRGVKSRDVKSRGVSVGVRNAFLALVTTFVR